jgi:hypothetical protein
MAIKFDEGTLAFLQALRAKGGKAVIATDTRICTVEVVNGCVEFTPTDQNPATFAGNVDHKHGMKVEQKKAASSKAPAKKTAAKPAAKKSSAKKSKK